VFNRSENNPEEEKNLLGYMAKNRILGFEGKIGFEFNKQNLRISEMEEK